MPNLSSRTGVSRFREFKSQLSRNFSAKAGRFALPSRKLLADGPAASMPPFMAVTAFTFENWEARVVLASTAPGTGAGQRCRPPCRPGLGHAVPP